jgi:lysophospholipase L1-like esterase
MRLGRLLVLSSLGLAGVLRATTVVSCVGDSITFGSRIDDRAHKSYPADLAGLLGPGYSVGNYGVSGATMLKEGDKPYWAQPAFEQAKASAPQIVIIMLGTNDSKPQNFAHRDRFEADAKALIELFKALPSKPAVYLCQTCPILHENYKITEENEAPIRTLLSEAARDEHIPLIDIHAALLGRPELFPDGIHPNAEGASLMARAVAAALHP